MEQRLGNLFVRYQHKMCQEFSQLETTLDYSIECRSIVSESDQPKNRVIACVWHLFELVHLESKLKGWPVSKAYCLWLQAHYPMEKVEEVSEAKYWRRFNRFVLRGEIDAAIILLRSSHYYMTCKYNSKKQIDGLNQLITLLGEFDANHIDQWKQGMDRLFNDLDGSEPLGTVIADTLKLIQVDASIVDHYSSHSTEALACALSYQHLTPPRMAEIARRYPDPIIELAMSVFTNDHAQMVYLINRIDTMCCVHVVDMLGYIQQLDGCVDMVFGCNLRDYLILHYAKQLAEQGLVFVGFEYLKTCSEIGAIAMQSMIETLPSDRHLDRRVEPYTDWGDLEEQQRDWG